MTARMLRLPSAVAAAIAILATAAATAAAAPPVVTSTSFSQVTTTSVTLEASLDPQEKTTPYHFEYISQANYEADGNSFGSGSETVPGSEGAIPAHSTAKGDLKAGSTVITNVSPIAGTLAVGQTVTGSGIPAGAKIEAVEVSSGQIKLTAATTATAAQVTITASGQQPVSAPLAGLEPATRYRFHLVAQHGSEIVTGPDAPFTTSITAQSFGPCPNDEFRTGPYAPPSDPSALLPDCRAYEQVSPIAKGGQDIVGEQPFLRAAPDGSAVSYLTSSGIPGLGVGGQEFPLYLSRRSAGGWSTEGLLPPSSFGESAHVRGWTPDFSQVLSSARHIGSGETTLLMTPAGGSASTVVPYGSGLGSGRADFETEPAYGGSSADGTLSYFESDAALSGTAGLQGKPNVYGYDRATGAVFLAAVLNDALPPVFGGIAGSYDWANKAGPNSPISLASGGASSRYFIQEERAVAADGSLIFTAAGTGQLYERLNPQEPQSTVVTNGAGEEECTEPAKACTVHLSATEKTNGHGNGGSDDTGEAPAAFLAASTDGGKALFASSEKLTNDATTGPEPPAPAIGRAEPGGGNVNTSFCPGPIAKGIALDGSHIYWASPAAGKISRMGLECEDPEVLVTGADNPQYVAVDSGHIYWTNAGNGESGEGTIGRAKLTAGGADEIEEDFIEGANNPQGIAVQGEFVYWANPGNELERIRTIGRAKLGAAEAEDVEQKFIVVSNDTALELRPEGMAVDATHIYMTIDGGFTRGERYVIRYDLSGNPASEKFFFDNTHGGVAGVRGIAVDSSYLYWARQGENSIGRIPLADIGSAGGCDSIPSCEPEFVKEAGGPQGLAVDTSHLYWSVNGEVQPNSGNDLYLYSSTPNGEGHHLSDLAPDIEGPTGAEVQGILGASEDLSYVYFVANGDLDGPGGSAQRGTCNGSLDHPHGECNLYLAHDGGVEYIARLDAESLGEGAGASDSRDWWPAAVAGGLEKPARVSPDGRTLVFASKQRLVPFDNDSRTELYRYRTGHGIACVSCSPTEAQPREAENAALLNRVNFGFPAVEPISTSPPTLTRNLSADGDRVFFETTEALVAADANGKNGCPPNKLNNKAVYRLCNDVYEWEAPGEGTCQEGSPPYSPLNEGCLYLLSGGTEERPSFFLDASESGDDVFLITPSQLVGQDEDQLFDVYDARVGGGLAAQNPQPSVVCEGESCKPDAAPQPASAPCGSTCFAGPGTPAARKPKRCPKHKKRKGTKCVAKKHHHRHHKRAHHSQGGNR